MLYVPEIIVSDDKNVWQDIANPETLATAWDASKDPEFASLFQDIRAFSDPSYKVLTPEELDRLETYAQQIIDNEIDPILHETKIRFSGYDPLHSWVTKPEDDITEETIPHRDHLCIGIFFYFNQEAGLSTWCVPAEHTGEEMNGNKTYPNADLSKAVTFPTHSVALIKLGELTHYAPSQIPVKTCRVVSHARYEISM